ncbi:MAG: N-6 DNA methylase [Pseudomonadota bacterium]|nr:N-6 DNA methylase [Pseudomonadota bacterium]
MANKNTGKKHATTLDTLHTRADEFAKDFAEASYEMGEAQDFIRGLCAVYGLSSRRAVSFERRIKKKDADGIAKGINRIDGLFPGLLLVEMKSAGKPLDKAYEQASGYIDLLPEEDLPRYVLVSDFQNLHLYDRQAPEAEPIRFKLADFQLHVESLGFLCGYEKIARERQEQANAEAAEKLADLHDAIKATGYTGHDLETLLVRILFCLFADDTELFGEPHLFTTLIASTRSDGRDLSGTLDLLFSILDTANGENQRPDERPRALYPELRPFPYVNGELFKGRIAPCYFDSAARQALIDCANIDWSQISPDIFGSLFQAIMHFDDEAAAGKTRKRREFGAHYTSETNILKVIEPLFLAELREELKAGKRDAKKLRAFLYKLRQLQLFDPACGCGNFLVVAYREIRLLEEEAIARIRRIRGQTAPMPECDVDQFHGIEIDPSAVQIATVALWLTDHQMNQRITRDGKPYRRLPLIRRANIVNGNALRMAWADVLPPGQCSYVMGNPPFIGAKFMNDEQRADAEIVFAPVKNGGLLDYVAAWHVTAARYIQGTAIPVAFVSTNSITQGEQVGVLWPYLLNQGIHIRFAHRTFRWSNEGRGVAAVHCVIIGFGLEADKAPVIYDYGDDIAGEPRAIVAKNINPYLVDAGNAVLQRRGKPLCDIPEMGIGNKPIDGGFYLFTPEEKAEFIAAEPGSARFFRPWLGAEEFLNGIERWCLWLGDASAADLAKLPKCRERIAAVQALRLASKSAPTRKLADFPSRFHVEFMPDAEYLVVPEVSSERRRFIPIGFIQPETLSSNLLRIVPKATLYHFGILSSTLHNAWMRTVCGRLKSDYRYSIGIVYNNFPWPTPTPAQINSIETAAQAVLDARTAQPDATLAQLYNTPMTTAPLVKSHQKLDAAVDAAYGYTGVNDDAARVAFLFTRYQALVQAAADKAKETEGSKK